MWYDLAAEQNDMPNAAAHRDALLQAHAAGPAQQGPADGRGLPAERLQKLRLSSRQQKLYSVY